MHFSLLEKLGAAVLICAWTIYGANQLSGMLVNATPLEQPAIAVAAVERAAPAEAASAGAEVDFDTLLAQADPAKGEKVFGKCKACHGVEEGGANKVGPNLWGVVGGPKAHMKDFTYSATLADMGAKGGKWGYEELNQFLISPKDYVAGTKMSFAGLKSAEDRANVIAFMRANTPNPPPLP
ncbi:MAG: cytochrome c family protein [Rhodospirillales bacterium]|nr:cytochrome c family protein [Rhodospirillales bacterium]